MLSAKASLDDRIAGLEHGVDDYITKPFSSTYLKIRITSLLRQRKELQEMYMAKLTAGKDVALSDDIPEPSQPQITPHDKLFMEKVMEFMEEQMDNPDLTICSSMNSITFSINSLSSTAVNIIFRRLLI